MPTYVKPVQNNSVWEIVDQVMGKYHGPLCDAEVTIGVLFAIPGENDFHAVKLHGYPCAAAIKITPKKDRVLGVEDAVLTIDEAHWKTIDDAQRNAIVDHELQHLDVQLDAEGHVKTDDAGRPKLKMRLHDWQLGGFEIVAARHRAAALEVEAFHNTFTAYRQCLFFDLDESELGKATAAKAAKADRPRRGRPRKDTSAPLLSGENGGRNP